MKKILMFAFAFSAYAFFIYTMLCLIGFVGNILTPHSIDGPAKAPMFLSFLIDLLLVVQFGLQHSVMARKWFKAGIIRVIPKPIERSVYVFASCLSLLLLMRFWHPLGGTVWEVQSELAAVLLYSLFFLGWTIMFIASMLINHWDLVGLRQVYYYCQDRPYASLDLVKPGLYKVVRHPLYLGLIIGFWATPVMSVTHLVFSLMVTLYILLGIRLEEKDLVDDFGERYLLYRKRIPTLVPGIALFNKWRKNKDLKREVV